MPENLEAMVMLIDPKEVMGSWEIGEQVMEVSG